MSSEEEDCGKTKFSQEFKLLCMQCMLKTAARAAARSPAWPVRPCPRLRSARSLAMSGFLSASHWLVVFPCAADGGTAAPLQALRSALAPGGGGAHAGHSGSVGPAGAFVFSRAC
jgi:hypothetical protein